MLDDQNYEHHLQHIFILISFKQNYQFAAYPVKDKGCTSILYITSPIPVFCYIWRI